MDKKMAKVGGSENHETIWPGVFVLLLILGAFLLLAKSSAAFEPRDYEEAEQETARISSLADESQIQNQKCRNFLDHVQSISSDSVKKEYFVSRASALGVLREAPRYPGMPIATNEALDLFLSMPTYPQGEKLKDLTIALNRLGDCYSVEFYGVLTRLIDPRTRAYFSTSEISGERSLVLSYIQHEAISGPKSLVQVENLADLLDRSIYEGLIAPLPETRVIIEDMKWTLAKMKTEGVARFAKIEGSKSLYFSSKSGDSKLLADLLDDLSWQLNQTDGIQEDLREASEIELENLSVPTRSLKIANFP